VSCRASRIYFGFVPLFTKRHFRKRKPKTILTFLQFFDSD
jgi:hypothetical protein